MRPWRLFSWKALREARSFAAAGGVAVHLSGSWIPPGRSTPTPCAHVFAPDLAALCEVAEELGMQARWIEYPDDPLRRHLDVWDGRLALALQRCENQEPIRSGPKSGISR